jgi:predicted DNA-binding protein (MmcQ/YjbR family)
MDGQAIERTCLALTGATLDHPFGPGVDTYRVGGKMFALVSPDGGVSFKVSDIAWEILIETGRARPAPYLARAKWVNLPDPSAWDAADLAGHLATAHAIVAAGLTRKARAALGLVQSMIA